MISVLLLPLFLAGTPAGSGGAPSGGEPPIQLRINNEGRFVPGDHARIQVRTKDSGYLLILHADPDGQLRVLFPLDPGDNNFVRGGERFEVVGRGGGEAFTIDGTRGRGMVYGAVAPTPFRFDDYQQGNHWDYHALAPSPLPSEPESELTDLVRRMAQGHFDYDVVTYEVVESVVYASDYSSGPSSFFASGDFFFGRPFGGFGSPFLFDFGFNPFFDPFVFDPFFQRPFFFDPFLHQGFFFEPFAFNPFFGNPFFFDPFFPRGFFFNPFFDPFVPRVFIGFNPFFRRPFFPPVFVNRAFRQPFFSSPRGLGAVRFRDRRNVFSRGVSPAGLTPWRTRGAVTATRGLQPVGEILRSHGAVEVSMRRREPMMQGRRGWPVDVSTGRRGLVPEAQRGNWPVDVSPRSRERVTEARRGNWPVDVSPRLREPGLPSGRRVVNDRPGLRPQIDPGSLPEGRRAWIEDRPGLEMAPLGRGGWEGFSGPSDWGSQRGGISWPMPGRSGGGGFGRFAAPSNGGGRGFGHR